MYFRLYGRAAGIKFGGLLMSVGMIKARAEHLDTSRAIDGRQFLSEPEKSLIMEVVWSLIIQGMLVPGLNDQESRLPFLRLTAMARDACKRIRILPHHPEGFIEDFAVRYQTLIPRSSNT